MSEETVEIVIGGTKYAVEKEFPFDALRTVVPAFFRCHESFLRGIVVEETFDDFIKIVTAAIATKQPEFSNAEAWKLKPKGLKEMVDALGIIAKCAGLELNQLGEAQKLKEEKVT